MRKFIINFKNYESVFGDGSVALAKAAEEVSGSFSVEISVAPPHPMLALVASKVSIPVFAQSVQDAERGRSTGAVLPEALKSAGVKGVMINHSEARVGVRSAGRLVDRSRSAGLRTCVCAGTKSEAVRLCSFQPAHLAIEPPDLIGTGIAVSKARPELVSNSVRALRESGYRGDILCGAGIVEGGDVERAVELGVDGILVASSVVKARDWRSKISELAESLERGKP